MSIKLKIIKTVKRIAHFIEKPLTVISLLGASIKAADWGWLIKIWDWLNEVDV